MYIIYSCIVTNAFYEEEFVISSDYYWLCQQRQVQPPASQPPPIAAKPQTAPKPQVAAKPSKGRQAETVEAPAAAAPQAVSGIQSLFIYCLFLSPRHESVALHDGDVLLFICSFVCLLPMRSCRPLVDWRSSP